MRILKAAGAPNESGMNVLKTRCGAGSQSVNGL